MVRTLDRADAQLRDRVLQQLTHTRDLDAHDIGVRAHAGCVTLVGSVRSFPEKVAATGAVKRLYGVRAIANEIAVLDDAPVSDADLERMAANALAMRAGVAPPVTARVNRGCVVLEGTVTWRYQQLAAETAVAYLPGVRSVENRITLAAHDGGERLREEIEQGLMRTAGLEWKRIRVDAADGRVRLSGTVFSLLEKEAAEHAAWAHPSVRDVDNAIDVVARRWW